MLVASFWLLSLLTCAFAILCGGKDGRAFAGIYVSGALLTIAAQLAGSWHSPHLWLLGADILIFAAFFWLMLRSASYWPIWVAASQFMAVITHIATLLITSFSERIYAGLSTVWVIPLMLFTIIGIEQDRKRLHDRAYPPGPRPA